MEKLKVIKDELNIMYGSLIEKVEQRMINFNTSSEKWQETPEGQKYLQQTLNLDDINNGFVDMVEQLDVFIDNELCDKCSLSKRYFLNTT